MRRTHRHTHKFIYSYSTILFSLGCQYACRNSESDLYRDLPATLVREVSHKVRYVCRKVRAKTKTMPEITGAAKEEEEERRRAAKAQNSKL
jgi:hypothetical protein